MVEQATVPCVASIVLRTTPPVAEVTKSEETTAVATVATRQSREARAIIS